MDIDSAVSGDMELLWWLVKLGADDRATYRVIRELMWKMFVDDYASSVKTSIPS
jgi:hypothetical protein